MKRIATQPVLARLLPGQPLLFALGEVVKVPGDEAQRTKASRDEYKKQCDKNRPAAR